MMMIVDQRSAFKGGLGDVSYADAPQVAECVIAGIGVFDIYSAQTSGQMSKNSRCVASGWMCNCVHRAS